jgi:hypothetical protein
MCRPDYPKDTKQKTERTAPMSEELKITKERVLEAAKECPTSQAVMKKLFPEVFEEDRLFDMSGIEVGGNRFFNIAMTGKWAFKSIYLSPGFQWAFRYDVDSDSRYLVPSKKD